LALRCRRCFAAWLCGKPSPMWRCAAAAPCVRFFSASSYKAQKRGGGIVEVTQKPSMMNPKVLLVEDNATIRATLVPALQELTGARVVATAECAKDALAALRQVDWNVMVLDLFLRDSTGFDVLAHMPEETAGRKVFVLTNYATGELREACLRMGADVVFDKSTELDEFFAAFME
jgi:CheY-like chemotaxis protein